VRKQPGNSPATFSYFSALSQRNLKLNPNSSPMKSTINGKQLSKTQRQRLPKRAGERLT